MDMFMSTCKRELENSSSGKLAETPRSKGMK